ncbi:MAG: hypothetical protein COV98_01635 [Candidatus Altarchaeum sp. CG12_big_fil_rev_8_21_14_0_65_33_22]|nr:MAG: hypothetical protein COV98_01635 [Candidatus Altarchaeum sp. CG12_big_fil_rev_8_21_14_0_65_33_22]PIX48944.1 MAG: hypothetical protein COZ53_02320 [Candidatus Altarchaeum sp. CG_4_8_14_3_um_filter_33_2054]PIZ32393.1 MAG: hypothetical protein COY41_01235 [Candidatus Altarchaeum sp. CG_4_10_14_0_8_um_filter_32_851]
MEYINVSGYKISHLILGTVQFGLNYGIANKTGKPSKEQVEEILLNAFDSGINALDTANAYGDSEKILGEILSNYPKKENIIIITKLSPKVNETTSDGDIKNQVEQSVHSSLSNLSMDSIPIYMLHKAEQMLIKDGTIIKHLSKLKEENLINNIGVSVYTPKEAETALSIDEITAVQVPFNVFDQRLIKSGFFEKAHSKGIAVFVRSIYLQGLILMDNTDVPDKLHEIINFKNQFKKICEHSGRTVNEVAMKFPLAQKGVTGIVFGVDNLNQLKENINLYNKPSLEKSIIENILNRFNGIPEYLLDPRQWS